MLTKTLITNIAYDYDNRDVGDITEIRNKLQNITKILYNEYENIQRNDSISIMEALLHDFDAWTWARLECEYDYCKQQIEE